MSSIGALILAAGGSSRLGRPKQLIQYQGQTLLRRAVDAASHAGCAPITVVVGSNATVITPELDATSISIVENQNWQKGMGTSIRAGVQHLLQQTPDLKALVMLVCDQPFVTATVIADLIALHAESQKPIVASSYSNTLGVPALFARSCFQELLSLDDGKGAKPVITANRERVAEFPFPKGVIDIDTVADYEKLMTAGGAEPR